MIEKKTLIERCIFYRNTFDGGDGWTYYPLNVHIFATCAVCGGPRGDATPGRVIEDGESFQVDNWSNPCGHQDSYKSAYLEHRTILAQGAAKEDAVALYDPALTVRHMEALVAIRQTWLEREPLDQDGTPWTFTSGKEFSGHAEATDQLTTSGFLTVSADGKIISLTRKAVDALKAYTTPLDAAEAVQPLPPKEVKLSHADFIVLQSGLLALHHLAKAREKSENESSQDAGFSVNYRAGCSRMADMYCTEGHKWKTALHKLQRGFGYPATDL